MEVNNPTGIGTTNSELGMCMLQASLLQFSRISELSWIIVIAINLYIVVVNETVPDQYEGILLFIHVIELNHIIVIYHVCVWVFSIVMTLIPLPIVYDYYAFNEIWYFLF